MPSVLLTGFEPFGTTPVNPAEQVARRLDGADVNGARIASRIVPNTFFTCIEVVKAAIAELQPEVVVMMGEYGGRATITVERIAQNLNDGARYGLRDNDGKLLQDVLTAPDGPVAYRSTPPIWPWCAPCATPASPPTFPIQPEPSAAIISCTGFCTTSLSRA